MPRAVAPTSRRRAGAALALAAVLGAAAPAGAQHPVPSPTRPLHARLAASDAVAVATVAAVSEGRIRLVDARALHGAVPPRFQVKRSPSKPPPLAAGDRALLLLRGARPPFVLVDRPDETIRLADPAAEARWVEALQAWLRVRSQPSAWPALYAAWIERGPETLRDLAVRALADRAAPYQPLPAAFAEDLADAAWDGARPLPARRAAAAVARLYPAGALRLVAGFLRAPGPADPELATAALAVAPRLTGATRDEALLRGLAHTDAEVRRAALQGVRPGGPPPAPALRERIALLARDDPESWLRAEAQQALTSFGAPP